MRARWRDVDRWRSGAVRDIPAARSAAAGSAAEDDRWRTNDRICSLQRRILYRWHRTTRFKATFTQTRVRVRVRVSVMGSLLLVQGSPARVERSRSLVQAHNSTRVYWQSPVRSNRVNALRKKLSIFYYVVNNFTNRAPLIMNNMH